MVFKMKLYFLYIFNFNLGEYDNKKYNWRLTNKNMFYSYTFLFEHLSNYTLLKAEIKSITDNKVNKFY